MEPTWEAILALEGTPTADGRLIRAGALEWRDLPLTLMAQLATAEGHDGARVAGRIDTIERVGDQIIGRGIFTDSPDGLEAARLAAEGTLTGVSIDLAVGEVELLPYEPAEGEDAPVEDDDAEPITVTVDAVEVEVTRGTIMGATLTPFPAFAEATITSVEGAPDSPALVAASNPPPHPPGEWFADPQLEAPTPLTITPAGRVFGHVAAWGTCHVGMPGRCVEPPTSATGYSQFLLGEVETAEGDRVPVGNLTLDTGHAPMTASRSDARRHYDDTGTAVADVSAGEDEFGIWIAGALRPSVTPDQVRALMAAKPSGDWRDYNGNLEMVGVLAVNVPGFPVPRTRVASAGAGPARGLAMVAAGMLVQATRTARVAGRITRVGNLEAVTAAAGCTPCAELAALEARAAAPALADLEARAARPALEALRARL